MQLMMQRKSCLKKNVIHFIRFFLQSQLKQEMPPKFRVDLLTHWLILPLSSKDTLTLCVCGRTEQTANRFPLMILPLMICCA